MGIKELLEKQQQLDNYIVKDLNLEPKERLTSTILALVVEVSELANELRCFKFWSKKPPSDNDTILFELVDCLHFFLSICNQLGFTAEDIDRAYMEKNKVNFERQNNNY